MAVYAEDQLKATSWLALNAGVRQTHFSGGGKRHQPALRSLASHSEIKLGLPRVLRPLLSSAPFAHRLRPLLQLATSQNLGFVPLWRARRGTPIRRHHPSSRLDTDADNFLTRQQLLRPQQLQQFGDFHPHHHRRCARQRLGAHAHRVCTAVVRCT